MLTKHLKQGRREDLDNRYFRSSWEANYARWLKWLEARKQIFKWEYESQTFWFEEIKRGTRHYTPDFKVWESEQSIPYFVEIKGNMTQKSNTKLKRMAKYYPDVKVIVIGSSDYYKLKNQVASFVPNWE